MKHDLKSDVCPEIKYHTYQTDGRSHREFAISKLDLSFSHEISFLFLYIYLRIVCVCELILLTKENNNKKRSSYITNLRKKIYVNKCQTYHE